MFFSDFIFLREEQNFHKYPNIFPAIPTFFFLFFFQIPVYKKIIIGLFALYGVAIVSFLLRDFSTATDSLWELVLIPYALFELWGVSTAVVCGDWVIGIVSGKFFTLSSVHQLQ